VSAIASVKNVIKRTGLPRLVRQLGSSSYREECALARRVVADIHRLGFRRVFEKHRNFEDNSRKYLDLDQHVEEVAHEAGKLGLLNSRPLRVLDIGCGSGYFLFTLKASGHDVLGIDLDDNPMYNDTIDLLKIPRVTHRVEKLQTLPDLGPPFDLITAFSICFDLHWREDVWGPEEWKFFLDDCRSRLQPGGRIFLNFNPATTRHFRFVPDEVEQFLRGLPEGRLTPSKERFTLVRA
jgi:2-polyprenyl-3-methyl-5-hydroxy-6-metoxy-1,4-benzoquinol methylase